jgi:hypothetical protein
MKISASSTPAPGRESGSGTDLIARLATVMKNARLDCECRTQLDEVLDRFAAMERRRVMRSDLSGACDQIQKIEAILPFLRELEELTATERDYGVYMDIALLFDDIANAAVAGADAMRRLYSSNDI